MQRLITAMDNGNPRSRHYMITSDFTPGQDMKRMSGADRREHLLAIAEEEFARRGLQGTTTAALAKRAGVTEPVLYIHFDSKGSLFEEAVSSSSEKRLQLLESRFREIPGGKLTGCVECMAEATIAVCIDRSANAVLTSWALLEAPEATARLHRSEIGRICLMWEQKLAQSIPHGHPAALISMRVVPFSVQACVAYGNWLAVLRHNEATGAALCHEFAKGVALAAAGQLNAALANPRLPVLGGGGQRATPR